MPLLGELWRSSRDSSVLDSDSEESWDVSQNLAKGGILSLGKVVYFGNEKSSCLGMRNRVVWERGNAVSGTREMS